MKKPTVWAGSIGAILVIFNVIGGAAFATHLTDIPRLNVAIAINSLGAIAIGALLIWVYFNGRKREDAQMEPQALVRDSAEDKAILARRRNWILGVIFFLEMNGSAPGWILNRYSAGITAVNGEVIFDVLINIALFYIIIELLRGKQGALQKLLYATVVAIIGWACFAVALHQWFGILVTLVMGAYIIFSIIAPVSRRNFRIANLVLLPLYVVLMLSAGYFDNRNIDDLSKKEALLEQQFTDSSNTLNSDYSVFLNKQVPDGSEIPSVLNDITARNEKITELQANIVEMHGAYEKQIPNIKQQESLESFKFMSKMLDIHTAQGNKLAEFMNYAKNLNFSALTEKQKEDIVAYKKAVDDFSDQFTQTQYQLSEAHLNY